METKREISFSRGGFPSRVPCAKPEIQKKHLACRAKCLLSQTSSFRKQCLIFSLEREIINNNIYIRGGGEITSHSTPFRVTEPSSARFGRFGCLTTLIKSDPGHTARKQLHWNNLVLRVGSKIGFNVTYNVYWLCLRTENPHRMSMERAIGTPILTEKQKKGKKAPKGTDPKGLNLATPQLIMRWVTITNEHEARSTDGVQKTPKNRKNLVVTYEGMTE